MDVRLVYIEIKDRLNKLDSGDYDNIQCYQVVQAFNKAQLNWCRRQLRGINQTRESAEQTKQSVHDLQRLLTSEPISGTDYFKYFETTSLPKNMLRFEKIKAVAETKECSQGKILNLFFVEEANADSLLIDVASQPSFEWGESFYTVLSNKVRIYHNKQFTIKDSTITYYRNPREISLENCENIDGVQLGNIDPEFNDDIVQVLIDETVNILAGDMEHMNAFNISKERKEYNT